MEDQDFTIGIEEEYLLVDAETFDLAEVSEALIAACSARVGDRVSPEYLRCQIEIGTSVCKNISHARSELLELRRAVAEVAAEHGLAPISAGCHPTAVWSEQTHRNRERYNQLHRDLAAVSDRMLICGMHVHVGVPDDDTRIDLMNQFSYFLPHLLALSASSPFWQGMDTGLASYRIGVFDNLPRTGLPPRFDSWSSYRRYMNTLVSAGLLEDGTKIWWDMRPSDKYPTLETRICDAGPQMDHVLSLAAVIQSTMRFLWRLKSANQRWRVYDNALLQENRWRAQRFGITEGLVDFGAGTIVPFPRLLEDWIALVREDAEALGCLAEVEALRDILTGGTWADRQRAVHAEALRGGADEAEACRAVTRHLVGCFLSGPLPTEAAPD